MSVRVLGVKFFRLPLETRFPFRYGIASMSSAPHLFVEAECEFDGDRCVGVAADLLPPKWFTKNPDTTFEEDDLPAMLRSISHAAQAGIESMEQPSVFRWWREVYEKQMAWAGACGVAPLLAGFGVSLIERAVLDAFCRHRNLPLHRVLRDNLIQADLGEIRRSLSGVSPADFVAESPVAEIQLRHTVGLGDPLRDADITSDDRVDDGLPQSLEANVQHYGLRYFKIKLQGNLEADQRRLQRLAELFAEIEGDIFVTVDGNENYRDIASFREHWESHLAQPSLTDLLTRSLLMVEQPIHRNSALQDVVGDELNRWPEAPPIIIDESDADLSSAPKAFALGYSGVSHKNCKGVIKGLANAAEVWRLRDSGREMMLSAEDLANYGPVALLQDLAVVAALGVTHVERNGHHYFAGLSGLPASEQERVLAEHDDLFARCDGGYAALRVQGGRLRCGSVSEAPFGCVSAPDFSQFAAWEF